MSLAKRRKYDVDSTILFTLTTLTTEDVNVDLNVTDWYNKTGLNSLEKAFIAHTTLYRIHPFLDGNKRICRLVLNKTLLDNGFPLLNISASKEEYFESFVKSVEKNEPGNFVEFSLRQYFRQIKEFLKSQK